KARVRALPGRPANAVPQVASAHGLRDGPVGASGEVPLAVVGYGLQEVRGDADGVVRVLAGDGLVRLALPVGVELAEVEHGLALLGELEDALDVDLGDAIPPGAVHRLAQRPVLARVQTVGGRLED